MKAILFFLFLGMVFDHSQAHSEARFTVLLRLDHSNGTAYEEVTLKDLESETAFEGKYFKIVKGKGKEAISFSDPDEEMVLRAATVYYHLSRARDFWVNTINTESTAKIGQMTIRLEMSNLFDDLGHYAHDNRNPQFNNALAIPAGETPIWVPEARKDKWGQEIWFRPMKKIDTAELAAQMGPNPLTLALGTLRSPFINYIQNQFAVTMIQNFFFPGNMAQPLQAQLIRYAGTIALTKVVYEGSKKMDRMFIDKWYYLDTAMVPEVIYHEYAHVVLSDHMMMSHSTPVVEGMADYFAAALADRRKVYGHVSGYSNSKPKDTQNKKPYGHWDESNRNATSDFVLAVLWDVRETLGVEVGDQVIYEARKTLKTESASISNQLLRSILDACEKKCPSPRRDKLLLYRTFADRGF